MRHQSRAQFSGYVRSGLIAFTIASVFSSAGCLRHGWTAESLHIKKPAQQLAAAYPEYFTKPFTLVIMTDESATCGMRETEWWSDWEEFMLARDCGFVLATSKEDSVDLVIAAQYDSVHAPVLVLPQCRRYLGDVGIEFLPMDMLVDSTAKVVWYWGGVKNPANQEMMLNRIDSIIAESRKAGK